MRQEQALAEVMNMLAVEARFLRKRTEEMVEELKKEGYQEVWDMAGRYATEELLRNILQRHPYLSQWQARELLFGEVRLRDHPIPQFMRSTVFGSTAAPDLAIGWPGQYMIAIEVSRGTGGAQLKNAIMQTAFHPLLGKYGFGVLVFIRQGSIENYKPVFEDETFIRQCEEVIKVKVILV